MVQSPLTEQRLLIADAVAEVAAEIGHSPAQIALRWVMNRPGVMSTILGSRTTDGLADNLGSPDFTPEPKHSARLNAASKIEPGFPHDMIMSPRIKGFLHGGVEIEPYGA